MPHPTPPAERGTPEDGADRLHDAMLEDILEAPIEDLETELQEHDAIPDTPEQRAYLRGWNDAMAASIRHAPQPPAISRRDMMAAAVLSAMVAVDEARNLGFDFMAPASVLGADALIAALDEGGEA